MKRNTEASKPPRLPRSFREKSMAIPFHDRDGWIWMNGEMIANRDAKIHVLSHGLHYASAVFEGERAYDGQVFKSAEHTARLFRSARLMGFEIPFAAEDIEAAKRQVMERMGFANCYLRPIAWRGSEQLSVAPGATKINVAVAAWEWGAYFPDRMKGIRMTHAQWRRPSPETAPCAAKASGLYMIASLSKQAAEAEGYSDALMLDWRGHIAEATGANIFFVRDGVLHTPIPEGFLNGITRQTIIALARAQGLIVHERAIWLQELDTFEECFLTGSAAEITPVAEIGRNRFKPGVITEKLMAAFHTATHTKV